MNYLFKSLAAAAALLSLTACNTALNSGHVVSVTERVIGLKVAQAVANETPEFTFGFTSTTVILMPTITNAQLNCPAVADTFTFTQPTLFDLGLGETFASQSYQTGPDTNSTSKPVIPK